MDKYYTECSIDDAYGISVQMLSAYASFLFDDYIIDSELTHYKVLERKLSKTKVKKLRGDVRRALKFLKGLPEIEAPPLTNFKSWVKKFDGWHKTLTAYHIEDYNSEDYTWKYLALSLHCYIDALHHVFLRFTKVKDVSQLKLKCKWCDCSVSVSWKTLLSRVTLDELPLAYLYLNFAHAEASGMQDQEKVITKTFDDVAALGRSILLPT